MVCFDKPIQELHFPEHYTEHQQNICLRNIERILESQKFHLRFCSPRQSSFGLLPCAPFGRSVQLGSSNCSAESGPGRKRGAMSRARVRHGASRRREARPKIGPSMNRNLRDLAKRLTASKQPIQWRCMRSNSLL